MLGVLLLACFLASCGKDRAPGPAAQQGQDVPEEPVEEGSRWLEAAIRGLPVPDEGGRAWFALLDRLQSTPLPYLRAALSQALSSEYASVRRATANLAAYLSTRDIDVTDRLRALAENDLDWGVRLQSAESLLGLTGDFKPLRKAIGASMASHDCEAMSFAAVLLKRHEILDDRFVPGLIALLRCPGSSAVRCALFALGAYGPRARAVIPALADCLPRTENVVEILNCATMIGDESRAMFPDVLPYVKEGQLDERRAAAVLFAATADISDEAVVKALREAAAGDFSSSMRSEARRALEAIERRR